MTWSAAIGRWARQKNRNGSQPAACFSASAVIRYGQMLDTPKTAPWPLRSHRWILEIFFRIDAVGKIWSKSDRPKRLTYEDITWFLWRRQRILRIMLRLNLTVVTQLTLLTTNNFRNRDVDWSGSGNLNWIRVDNLGSVWRKPMFT